MDGNKIRKLRKEKGFNIDDLASKSGFTSSYISQVERNLIEPSLSALDKICKALNISVYYFLDDTDDKIIITRKNERQKLITPEDNSELQFLVPIKDKKTSKVKFGVYERVIEPGNWDNQGFNIIDSDKCVIVKTGTILLNLNDLSELLQEGDSVYIVSNLPHKFYNPTDENVEILCITMPSIY